MNFLKTQLWGRVYLNISIIREKISPAIITQTITGQKVRLLGTPSSKQR